MKPAPTPRSWVLEFFQRAELARRTLRPIGSLLSALASIRLGKPLDLPPAVAKAWTSPEADRLWYVVLGLAGVLAAWRASAYVGATVPPSEVALVLGLGFITLLRVVVLIFLASLIWVPVGVWIGLRPRWAATLQPVTQFLAAFPANLLFPVVVAAIVRFDLTPDIWLSPLMILGAQWYILFNVIAGARAFPADLLEVTAALRLKGLNWWRKAILPGIFPAYVTGAVTAGGGAWNAAIVAEVANWGPTRLSAHGLGAYIAEATTAGDLRRVVLGVAVMSLYVVLFNRLVWDRLFTAAARRLRTE